MEFVESGEYGLVDLLEARRTIDVYVAGFLGVSTRAVAEGELPGAMDDPVCEEIAVTARRCLVDDIEERTRVSAGGGL